MSLTRRQKAREQWAEDIEKMISKIKPREKNKKLKVETSVRLREQNRRVEKRKRKQFKLGKDK